MAGIFGGSSTKPVKYTEINIQTSTQGLPIPILWGKTRAGTNILWYNNFQAKPAKSGKGGGGKGGNYTYSAALILGICEGGASGIAGITQVYAGQSVESLSYYGLGLFSGAVGQAGWSYLSSAYPSQYLNYSGTAYVANSNYNLGSSPDLPSHNFEVEGLLYGTAPYGSLVDCNPADVLTDYLTNPYYGAQFPQANIDNGGGTSVTGGSWQTWKTYCQVFNLFFSPYLYQSEQSTQTIDRWAQITNTWIFWSGNLLKAVPLGTNTNTNNGLTYTANTTPVYNLTYDDFIFDGKGSDTGPVEVTRIDPLDGYNQVEIDIKDRANAYNTSAITWKDQNSVDLYGQLQSNVISAPEVCDASIATYMCSLIGKRSVYIRNTYKFTVGYHFVLLEPGDIVTINDPNIGLSNFAVRIQSIDEDEHQQLTIVAEEFPYGIGNTTAYVASTATYNPPYNPNVSPGSCNTPGIVEPNAALTGGTPQIWMGASGGANWGGCNVYVSFDGGTNYVEIGTIEGNGTQGVLTANLPATADPDTTDTLSVNLTESDGSLPVNVSHADADAFRTLILVDNELMSFGAATLTAAYTYSLTYLRRGLYGTTVASHSTGALFTLLAAENIFTYDLPQAYIGSTLNFKLQGINTFDTVTQDLSTCTAYPYTTTGAGYYIAPPTSPSLSVSRTTQADGTTLLNMNFTWTASAGPLLGSYEVQISTNGGSSFGPSITVGAGATSYTLTPAMASTSYEMRVRAISTTGINISSWAASSAVSSGTLVAAVPSAPSGVTATAVGTQAQISWTTGPQTNLFYTISRAAGTGASFSSASIVGYAAQGSTTFLDTTTSASTGYTYFVQASNAAGTSSASSGVNCTTGTVASSLVVEVNNTVDSVGTISFNSGFLGTISGTTLELSVPTQLTLESLGTVESASVLNFGSNLAASLSSGTLTISGVTHEVKNSSAYTTYAATTLAFDITNGSLQTNYNSGTLYVSGAAFPNYYHNGTITDATILNVGSGINATVDSPSVGEMTISVPTQLTLESAGTVVSASTLNISSGLTATVASGVMTLTSGTLVLENGGTVITPGTLNFGGGTTISQSGSIATLSVGGGGSGGAGTLELYQGGSYTPFGTLVATNGVSAAVASSTLTLQGISYANQGTLIAQPAVSTFNTAYVGGSSTLSNGNLTFNGSNSGSYNWTNTFSTVAGNIGTLYYFEVTFTAGAAYYMIGLADISINLSDCLGRDSNGIGFENNGHLYSNGDKGSGTSPTYTPPCTLGLAWNTSTNQVWVQTASGVWFGGGNPVTNTGGTTYLMSTTAYPAVAIEQSGGSATANFGATAFAYPVPSGYVPWGVSSTLNVAELNFTTGLSAVLNNNTLTIINSDTLVLQNSGTILTAGTLNFGGGTTISTSGGIATLSVGSSGGGGGSGTGSLISRPALSAFTWLNQGSATATDNTNGPLTIQSPTTTGDNLRYLIQPTPVANTSAWTITAQLRGLRPLTNYVPIGLVLYDSSSGKALTISSQITGSGYNPSPYCYVNVNAWNSTTSYNTSEVSFNMMLTEPFWMRVYCDGTNFNFQVSADGYDWLTIKTLSVTAWGSPDHVGFGMDFIDTSSVGLQPEVKLLNWNLRTGTGSGYVPPTYSAGGYAGGTPPAIVQTASGNSNTAAVTFSAAPTSGNLLVCIAFDYTTQTAASGWTVVVDNGSGTDYGLILTKRAGAGESTTQTPLSGSASPGCMVVWELSGAATGFVFGESMAEQSTNNNSTPPLSNLPNMIALAACSLVQSSSSPTITSMYGMTQDILLNTGSAGTRAIVGGHSTLATAPGATMLVNFSATANNKSAVCLISA